MNEKNIYLKTIQFESNLYICLYNELEDNYLYNNLYYENLKSIHIFLNIIKLEDNLINLEDTLIETEIILEKIIKEGNDDENLIKHKICISGTDIIYLSKIISCFKKIDYKIFLYLKIYNKINIPLIGIIYIFNISNYLKIAENSELTLKFIKEKLLIKNNINLLIKNKYKFIENNINLLIKNIYLKQILIGFNNSLYDLTSGFLKIFKFNLITKKYELYKTIFDLIFSEEIILINCNLNLKGDYLITFYLSETLQFNYNLFTNMFNEGIFREENINNFKFIDLVFIESSLNENENLSDFDLLLKYLINWKIKKFTNLKILLIKLFKFYKESNLINNIEDNLLGCLIILFDFSKNTINDLEKGIFKLNNFIINYKYKKSKKLLINELKINKEEEYISLIPKTENFNQILINEFIPPNWSKIHFSKLLIPLKDLSIKNNFNLLIKENKELPKLPLINKPKINYKEIKEYKEYKKLIYGKIIKFEKTIFNENIPIIIFNLINKRQIKDWMLPISILKDNNIVSSNKFYEKRILVVSLCVKNLEKKNINENNIESKLIEYFFNDNYYNENSLQINEIKCLKKLVPEKDEVAYFKTSYNLIPIENSCFYNLKSSDKIENFMKIAYFLNPTLKYLLFYEEFNSYLKNLTSCLFKYITSYYFILKNEELKLIIFIIEYICSLINEIQTNKEFLDLKNIDNKNSIKRIPFNITSIQNILEYYGKGNKRIIDLLIKSYKNLLKDKNINNISINNSSIEILKKQINEIFGYELQIFNKLKIKKNEKEKEKFLKNFYLNFSEFLNSKNVFKENINLHIKSFNKFINLFNEIFNLENENKVLRKIFNSKKYENFKTEKINDIKTIKKLFEIIFYLQKRVCEYFGVENIEEIINSIEYLLKELENGLIN